MEQLIDTQLLEYFDPKIRPFVENIQTEEEFGILPGSLNIFDACSGCPQDIDQRRFDRFKLSVPYCGQNLTWEVIFDCSCPEEPPDFIFGPDDDDFLPPMEEMESLSKWDATKHDSLLLMIKELLRYYRQHNNIRAAHHHRIEQDISSLLTSIDLNPNDLELYITGTEVKAGVVYIVLRLQVDFSQIPAYLIQANPGEDQAVLYFTYPSPDSSRVTPVLHLSPRVENALGGATCLRIPSYTSGTLLGDYVAHVKQQLDNKVTQVVRGFEKRKEYIAAFLSQFGRCVIEYDLQTFSNISFLFEWNDFFFIYAVELPLYFPAETPKFTFQSVYHEVKGQPYFETVGNFPYSPRWSADEMASRAKLFIMNHISKFQRASVLAKQK
ncbi:BRISC and BRCA1-A complex member 2-like [Littorina saxatilis]|uniref:BRISC and BRCA1-A complex member 2 n=1 Tax=Littorina saxatilis TaxID=31220 RepID=A0AAN9GE25_9CAEN